VGSRTGFIDRIRLISIAETFNRHRVSKTHPMKTVSHMARQEVIETTRGRSSGLHLLGQPGDISIGDFDRSFETDFTLAECFD